LDLIMTMWESMDIDFDETGNPRLPTIVASSKIREQLEKQEITDEQKERFEQLIERKRFEWRDRESNRKLVS